jgi:uncharacterized protein (TIGR04255 family)
MPPAGDPLPTKLEKEPLVDAVFEMRFAARVPASSVIPGILFTHLEAHPQQIERLPVADIPSEIRSRDPNLRFQPLMRLHWDDNFLIMVGDATVGLACKMPYAGWKNFKPHILRLTKILNESHLIERLDRYSMKYVAIIEGANLAAQISLINISLKLGDYTLKEEPFIIRVERREGSLLHIVQLGAPSTGPVVTDNKQTTRTGLLIDIDSVCERDIPDMSTIIEELPERLEDIHTRNKERFFELLTPETLAYLGPSYEPVSA